MVGLEYRLKDLRLKSEMSQKDLAAKLGVTKSVISAYERGSRRPSYDVLIHISQIFKVSTDYLLGQETKDQIDLSGLSEKEIEALRMLVKAMKER